MRYADTLLIPGEEVALRTRQHWLAFVISARYGIVLWIVGVLLLVAVPALNLIGFAAQVVSAVALILFILGLVIVGMRYWQWWAQDYMVTSRRLMKVWGVLNKRSVDSALEHINDARLDQSFFGRLLNYGHLEILTAAEESTLDDYDMIKDPKGFKKVMLTQKHALDSGYERRAPTPPLRTSETMQREAAGRPEAAPIPDLAVATQASTTQALATDASGTHGSATDAPGSPASATQVPATETPASAWGGATTSPDAGASGEASDAEAPGSPPAGATAAAQPSAATQPSSATQSSTATAADSSAASLEVTQTLARLADLRDRGAITAEDYEAKKRELLDRL